jgi:HSP20 family protein
LDELYKEMDHLVHQFLSDDTGSNGRDFVPTLNVAESDNAYEVTVDLPGVKPEDVSVELHENQVTISGKREVEHEEMGRTFHRIECRSGEFRRVVALPVPVDETKISADYHQGVLKVVLPKSEKVKPTRITVKSS